MWDNHQMLGSLANSLFALAVLIASYYITKWVVNLPLLPLKEVSVSSTGTGRLKHVTHEQITDSVRSQAIGNFLTVDLDAARRAFGKLPWVRTASVRRVWPDSLELKIEEHVVLARWGNRRLVNIRGEIFEAASDEPLPLFEGMDESAGDMARHYAIFSELLRPIGENIGYMRLSPRRAWTLRLGNGTTLELGREQLEARLRRYVLAHSHGFGKTAMQLGYVDLRYPNGFAAR
ncbi:MAG TPA: cell division protein FtsQ/DivIB [Nitrosospira sp.]|nr:cell division protein FtsQ/DivIB [Nitrosospira sp.]